MNSQQFDLTVCPDPVYKGVSTQNSTSPHGWWVQMNIHEEYGVPNRIDEGQLPHNVQTMLNNSICLIVSRRKVLVESTAVSLRELPVWGEQ
jgi:hypothetical protein